MAKKLTGMVKTIFEGAVVNGTIKNFKNGVYVIKVARSVALLRRHEEAVWR